MAINITNYRTYLEFENTGDDSVLFFQKGKYRPVYFGGSMIILDDAGNKVFELMDIRHLGTVVNKTGATPNSPTTIKGLTQSIAGYFFSAPVADSFTNTAPAATATFTANVGGIKQGLAQTLTHAYSDVDNDEEEFGIGGSEWELRRYTSAANGNADTTRVGGTVVTGGYFSGPSATYTPVAGDVGGYFVLWVKPVARFGIRTGSWARSATTTIVLAP